MGSTLRGDRRQRNAPLWRNHGRNTQAGWVAAVTGALLEAHIVRGATPSHGISGTLEMAFFGEPVKMRSE